MTTSTDGRRTVTIAEIAALAGVSVPTVSKVLNGRADVAAATRARVEAILEEHSYRRRRGRGSGDPSLIDLVFHHIDNAWAQEVIKGVEDAAAARRVGVVLSELGGAHRPPQDLIDDILARRPLGVLLVLSTLDATQRHQLESRSIPFVVVDTFGEPPAGVPTVGSNNWNGGLIATRHLLALGHRRIGVIAGPPDVLCSRARVDGYRSALAEAGVEADPDLVRWGDFHVTGGYEHGLRLLQRADRPTAIFAGSDYQCLGVMRAVRELGLSIPEDVSVVGYDDIPLAQWLGPSLTTVRQPLREMAGTATQMVLSLAAGERPANLRIDLATELVVRESTAPAPA
ncbi:MULTISPECIES: LacI family DNA-binding transcriptional regulator [Cellulomonas]|uniref:LacI family DNA-binding transcriptional regulator n=1 Tax=Cellulomonas TaxID=1707 RepID=UPI000626940D|nr:MULTISPECIES: LacI family DNA-binding transcriptional regulator [Cellulomonas]MBO9569148.1 LacI family DNA-binding transcriptional regulator [Cellulomonas iranensis]TFH71872.1 LacI family transcriptional regulator [Cellulomonas sp. HD19AZ1]UCN15316.1 LacI family DNA-binding transcriptional regulator [Cellulomonas iranensis]